MIAHRLSTVVNCDKILVLNKVTSEILELMNLFERRVKLNCFSGQTCREWNSLGASAGTKQTTIGNSVC